MNTLKQKEEKSKKVLKEALERYGEEMAVAFTGGKDSIVVLHLLKEVMGSVDLPVLFVDTSVQFPEIYQYRDRIAKEWNLNLQVARNEEAIATIEIAKDRELCCHLLKTEALREAIKKGGWKALLTGIRWDEQEARSGELYFSPRSDHVRVHPILHFTESDIWNYIRKYNIPYCSLYDQGFRSVGCVPCTKPSPPDGPERAGRSQDKEEIMARLRALGYF
jgi:phosphoadenosine phosphosulfate reductase